MCTKFVLFLFNIYISSTACNNADKKLGMGWFKKEYVQSSAVQPITEHNNNQVNKQ